MVAAASPCSLPSADNLAVILALLDDDTTEDAEEEAEVDGDLEVDGGVGTRNSFGMAPDDADAILDADDGVEEEDVRPGESADDLVDSSISN